MDAEQVRGFLLSMPDVAETMQWGENLVYWVADKTIGGKMFAVLNLARGGKAVLSFAAGPEAYAELLEQDGVIPAPYLARAYWVSLEHWNVLSTAELEQRLIAARRLIYEKLPRRTKDVLAMSPEAQRKLLVPRGKNLADRGSSGSPKSQSKRRTGKRS